jgi:hypothetical protein
MSDLRVVCYKGRVVAYATTPGKVEVAPGVLQRLDRCAVGDLAAARAVQVQKVGLRTEAELLLADAARHDLPIAQDLRDRLALWCDDLPGIRVLVDELRAALLRPV